MRLLGIDYGMKRVGVALSNADGSVAFPHDVLTNDADLLQKLATLIAENGVEKIVIGQSLSNTGDRNPLQDKIEELMTELTLATGLPIEPVPEQYSTKAATRTQGKNAMTDASAAALILNSYIERTENT